MFGWPGRNRFLIVRLGGSAKKKIQKTKSKTKPEKETRRTARPRSALHYVDALDNWVGPRRRRPTWRVRSFFVFVFLFFCHKMDDVFRYFPHKPVMGFSLPADDPGWWRDSINQTILTKSQQEIHCLDSAGYRILLVSTGLAGITGFYRA